MPWCPKCKNEYRNGMTTCADCKVALVDSLDDIPEDYDLCELAIVKQKATALGLVKYLRYSGIGFVDIKAVPESRSYQILVDSTEKKEAFKHYKAFLAVEAERELQKAESSRELSEDDQAAVTASDSAEASPEENDSEYEVYVRDENEDSLSSSSQEPDKENDTSSNQEDSSLEEEFADLVDYDELPEDSLEESESVIEETETLDSSSNQRTYVKKEDAYQDNHSTGTMFLGFSIAGFVFIGLNLAGIIPFITGTFQLIVITLMFIAFFFIGIYSLKRAKEVAGGIDAEKEMTAKITAYLESLGDIKTIDDSDWEDLNDELLYFKRTTRLKQMVIEKFGTLNDAYLDCIIEEYYNAHF